MLEKSMAKNAAFSVLYRLFNVIFPLISVAYISRAISPEGVGRVGYGQNIVSYFLVFATLGGPVYGTREAAKCRNDASALNRLFSELMILNAGATLISLLAYLLVVRAAFSGEMLLYLILSLDLVFNFINIDWLYQGQEEYAYITVRSILIKLLSLIAMFLFVKDESDYTTYALILCFGVGGNHLFNIYHVRNRIRLTLRGLNVGRHIKPVAVLLFSSMVGSIYSKIDVTLLGGLSTPEAVGFYTNAQKVINIALTLVTAISAVFLPRLSNVFANDKKKFEEYLSLGLKVILFLGVPAGVGLALVAEDATWGLFGEAFMPAARILRIFSVLIVIKGAGDLLCYQAIISSGQEKKLVLSRVIAAMVGLLMNMLLIPGLDYCGAAIALVVSELAVNGIMLRHSLKIARPSVERNFLISILASTALMAAAVLSAQTLSVSPLLSLTFAMGAGAATYVAGMMAFCKEIQKFIMQWKEKLRKFH